MSEWCWSSPLQGRSGSWSTTPDMWPEWGVEYYSDFWPGVGVEYHSDFSRRTNALLILIDKSLPEH